jgi:hypothetical protein
LKVPTVFAVKVGTVADELKEPGEHWSEVEQSLVSETPSPSKSRRNLWVPEPLDRSIVMLSPWVTMMVGFVEFQA